MTYLSSSFFFWFIWFSIVTIQSVINNCSTLSTDQFWQRAGSHPHLVSVGLPLYYFYYFLWWGMCSLASLSSRCFWQKNLNMTGRLDHTEDSFLWDILVWIYSSSTIKIWSMKNCRIHGLINQYLASRCVFFQRRSRSLQFFISEW